MHSLVDDHSRLAYSEILPDEKGTTCAAFLTRAAAYLTAHGIDRIQRVMTDNAWAYRWSLREVIAELRARQMFIKPHCPWQNGKSNGSTAPWPPNGRTGRSSPATRPAPPPLPPGSPPGWWYGGRVGGGRRLPDRSVAG